MPETQKPAQKATKALSPEDLDKVVGGGSTGPAGDLGPSAEKGAKFGGSKESASK